MAIDIAHDGFRRWLIEQSDETRRDMELFWRREVIRHPFIRAHPETGALLRRDMVLRYAYDEHGYDPAAPVDEAA